LRHSHSIKSRNISNMKTDALLIVSSISTSGADSHSHRIRDY